MGWGFQDYVELIDKIVVFDDISAVEIHIDGFSQLYWLPDVSEFVAEREQRGVLIQRASWCSERKACRACGFGLMESSSSVLLCRSLTSEASHAPIPREMDREENDAELQEDPR